MTTSRSPGRARHLTVGLADPDTQPARGRRYRPTRGRRGVLAAAGAVALLVASPAAATASATTAMLGNTSVPRIPRNGIPAASDCPAGSSAVGLRVWYIDNNGYPLVTGVASLCRDAGGAVAQGGVAGAQGPLSGDSQCSGADVATGLYGSWGEVLHAVGVRCTGTGGVYEAALVGRTNPTTAADCPAGDALVGVTAWSNVYGGPINVYGLQGSCDRRYTVSGVLQPVNADGTSIFKAGRTVPVKFTATDSSGASVTELAATLSVTKLTDAIEGTYVEAETNVAASTGFRYDASTGQYVYNWSTAGLGAGTYRIRVTIVDGPTFTADLSLR